MSGPLNTNPQPSDKLASDHAMIRSLVISEFAVEEDFIEHNVLTFYIQPEFKTKQAFLRLVEKLDKIGFVPMLRKRDGRNVLKVASKPKTKPSRSTINIILLLVTIVTVYITGYLLSLSLGDYGLDPWVGGATFTAALLGILGDHEMGHKLTADRHMMEATMPYFIPGPPPIPGIGGGIGTFGAVIVQKENAPNRDALFDIGASGPIVGFLVTILVSAIGLAMSPIEPITQPLEGGLPVSLLFRILTNLIVEVPGPGNYVIHLHPVAFAGWIGLFITLLNLLPTGMLDGGHTIRSLFDNDTLRLVFTIAAVLVLLGTEQYIMLAFVLFLSMYKHPGPLDDVSKLSITRKLGAILLLVIFILCLSIF
jgi:Zn-dependent protease